MLELFGRSGPVSRLVLPPSHALALIEYCEPQDARAAFKVRTGDALVVDLSWNGDYMGLLNVCCRADASTGPWPFTNYV